jgi:hypothetical protein
MLLFRSEEEVDAWCRAHERPRGAVVPIGDIERLAREWYGDRLDRAWRPRSRDESQAILAGAGLGAPFWELP